MKHKSQNGFTLIELLVVVAIISLLSSVILSSIASAREKAAISNMIQQVRSVQNALELYRADNGSYPATGASTNLKLIVLTDQDNGQIKQYIKKVDINTNNIRSFKINNGEIFYNSNANSLYECEDDTDAPYIIYITPANANALNLNFEKMIFAGYPGFTQGYCIYSPI